MVAIISLFIIIIASILIIRIATIALVQTGMSEDVARFQAISAFTTSGFTSSETEQIFHSAVRRRIVSYLMLWGNAGTATAISSIVLSFASSTNLQQTMLRLILLLISVIVLYMILRTEFIDRKISTYIKNLLKKYANVDANDYADLLRVKQDYAIAEVMLHDDSKVANKKIQDCGLSKDRILVIGITKANGHFIGSPKGTDLMEVGDHIIMYGNRDALKKVAH